MQAMAKPDLHVTIDRDRGRITIARDVVFDELLLDGADADPLDSASCRPTGRSVTVRQTIVDRPINGRDVEF
jgi:hypothetical protein